LSKWDEHPEVVYVFRVGGQLSTSPCGGLPAKTLWAGPIPEPEEAVATGTQQRHAARAKAKPCPTCNGEKYIGFGIDGEGGDEVCPTCRGAGTASA